MIFAWQSVVLCILLCNNVHSYISWGLNFVGSPGHKIYAPRKFDTQNVCPMKMSTITVWGIALILSVSDSR